MTRMVSENEFLLHAFFMGTFITFVYDLFRILRRAIPHGLFWISVEDLFFWIYCSVKVFMLLYHEGNGTLRWFAVLGVLTGMFLYMKLISGLLVKFGSCVLGKILEILGKILLFLLKPVGFLSKKAGAAAGKASSRMKRIRHRIKRAIKLRLTIFIKMLRINLKA